MAGCLIAMGACGLVTNKDNSLNKAIVAMVYIFLVVFNLGWGPTVWVITSEIATGKNRNKLMAFSTMTNWLFTWLVSFTFPYLFNADAAGMEAKIGFLYGSLMVCANIWTYFMLPETAGRSLEELHQMFEMGLPAKDFKSNFSFLRLPGFANNITAFVFPENHLEMKNSMDKEQTITQIEFESKA